MIAGHAKYYIQPEYNLSDTATLAEFLQQLASVETWRPISAYPNYEVSSFGCVRGPRKAILTPAARDKYPFVTLSHKGLAKCFRIHRLVALAFLGLPPFEGAIVAHNDGDPSNNLVSNLRWASYSENQADCVRHGTRLRGSEVKGSKLVESDIAEIRRRAISGETYRHIASDFGVSISSISLIKKGRTWSHA